MRVPHPALHRRMEAVRPKLFRTAFAWCHNRDLAEDLAQETLAKALTKVGQLRSMDALEGWLFRIMANLWRDHVRRDRPMDTMEDVDVRTEETPEDINSQQQTVTRVRRALGKLPDNYRIALTLVDLEGFSYSETAVIMEVPVGTVMSRLSRGRSQLAKLLKESGNTNAPYNGKSHVQQVK
jgi:RNA polymerase sigma-70 factor, ECF subfamily